MAAATLREFEALVGRVGGRERLLLVAEAGAGEAGPRALLEAFARDLFGASPPTPREEKPPEDQARRRRVQVGRRRRRGPLSLLLLPPSPSPSPSPSCPALLLLFVLFRASALLQPRRRSPERRRLREILRDLRGRLLLLSRPGRSAAAAAAASSSSLPAGLAVAVVGVALLDLAGEEGEEEAPPPVSPPCTPGDHPCCLGQGQGEAARAHLEAMLRRVFFGAHRRRRRRRLLLRDTLLQAATYRPGGDPPGGAGPASAAAAGVREAACRALRAALQLRADEVATKKRRLPLLWPCLPWGCRRRPQKEGDGETAAEELREDELQAAEEGMALTHITPNGKCEEVQGRAGS